MKKKYFLSVVLAFVLNAIGLNAQITITPGASATALANKLAGPGVVVMNAVLTCPTNAEGIFSGPSILSFDSGIVLTNGQAATSGAAIGAGGPASNFASTGNGTPGDAQLTVLAGQPTNDACVLQFDFRPIGDTIKFEYVFGSEEYTNYTCTNFNDVFGFFISGPGYGSPTNLAKVPGTNIPVCINSVNCGATGGGSISTCNALGAGAPFCAYYVNNFSGSTITYDGLTTTLTAIANVTPCDTYHLKLGVADAVDDVFDSGVFLKASSLKSISFGVLTVGSNPTDTGFGAQYCVRGCRPGKFVFINTGSASDPVTVYYIIAGTGINGTDYTTIPDSAIIPAFALTDTVYINGLTSVSGTKTVKLYILAPFTCSGATVFYDSVELTIYDHIFVNILTPDTSICFGGNVTINTTGFLGQTYLWSPSSSLNNSSLMSPTATPTVTTTYTVTATLAGTDCTVTATETISVNPVGSPITGASVICMAGSTTFTNPSVGGTWSSSNPGVASVNPVTGLVTGISAGTTTINYSGPTWCPSTKNITVMPGPSPIVGPPNLCTGVTAILTDAVPGGTWSTTSSAATIDPVTGTLTGTTPGTALVSYTFSGGCQATFTVTINNLPPPISGDSIICSGSSTIYTNPGIGGTWSSSNPLVAAINASTGLVTGLSIGTATISYSAGCPITKSISILSGPSLISGPNNLCFGDTIYFSDLVSGGTWTTTSATLSLNPVTGSATGLSLGTAIVTYSLSSGCETTFLITINPIPAPISGLPEICVGSTTVFSSTTPGANWSSSNTAIASINFSTGLILGLSTGSAIISYINSSGCPATKTISVMPIPASIVGSNHLCNYDSISLTDATLGGTWITSPGIASVNPATGALTGVAPGTTIVTYTLPSGCRTTAYITVNPAPGPISGPLSVCPGTTITLSDILPGGTWSSTVPGIASIGSSTGITVCTFAGFPTIKYLMPSTGCYSTVLLTINPLPANITGATTACVSAITSLTDATPGGTWTSSNPSIAIIGSGSGLVTGVSTGTTTISYTLTATGCSREATITVDPLPSAISGNLPICVGSTEHLTDPVLFGTWTSGNPLLATIDNSTGIISGLAVGTTSVSYSSPVTGCTVTAPITINPLPLPIVAPPAACVGSNFTFIDANPGGVWSSSNPSVAQFSIGTSGVATGISAGTTIITYTLASTGCQIATPITVNPYAPAITGPFTLCPGTTITLANTMTGGTWTSSNGAIAGIGATNGILSGIAAGTVNISYGSGCNYVAVVTVNPLPANILGLNGICTSGSTITLGDASAGGVWYSNNPVLGAINSSGVLVSSSLGGTGLVIITYTLPTNCFVTHPVTVNPLPNPILGTDTLCVGSTSTFTDASSGGTFMSSDPSIAAINFSSGNALGVTAGNTIITYLLSTTGCFVTHPILVEPTDTLALSAALAPNDTVCAGTPVSFSAHSVNGGINPVFQWTKNSINVLGANDSNWVYIPNNHDTIRCILVSGNRCSMPRTVHSAPFVIDVIPIAHPELFLNTIPSGATHDTLCAGTPNTFNVTDSAGGSSPVFHWFVNYAPVGTGVANFTYTPTNGDIVQCTMLSNAQCPQPATVTVTDTIVTLPSHTPVVSIGTYGGMQVCQGNPVTITANPTWGGWSPTYNWSINGNLDTATGSQLTYFPNTGDSVKCVMVSNYRCDTPTNTAVADMAVIVDPVIIVDVIAHPGILVPIGGYDTLVASITNGGYDPTYQWYKNGIAIPGATSTKYISNDFRNTDSVICVVTTGSGTACEGVQGYNWVILAVCPAGTAQVINPQSSIVLMPNPNKGSFWLKGNLGADDQELLISVTNTIGQVVFMGKAMLKNNILQKNIVLGDGLPTGIYFVNISGKETNQVIKFTLER